MHVAFGTAPGRSGIVPDAFDSPDSEDRWFRPATIGFSGLCFGAVIAYEGFVVAGVACGAVSPEKVTPRQSAVGS
jgi:hypothetical protein